MAQYSATLLWLGVTPVSFVRGLEVDALTQELVGPLVRVSLSAVTRSAWRTCLTVAACAAGPS